MSDDSPFHPPNEELERRAQQFSERATKLLDELKGNEGDIASKSTTALLYFLQMARCYAELDRRQSIERADRGKKDAEERAEKDRKRENRHFWAELIVIGGLIVLEIGLSIYFGHRAISEGREQAAILKQMNKNTADEKDVLDKLNTSSGATADSLVSVKDSLSAMKLSLEKQAEAFYDVQLNVIYHEPSKKLMLINDGRARVELWALRIADDEKTRMPIWDKPQIITPSADYEFSMDEALKLVAAQYPKGQEKRFNLRLFVKNQKGERFTLTGELIGAWNRDTPTFRSQPHAILPGWREH